MTSPYRVRAHNAATESENKIHDDAVARQYGFRGGLVPGVTVYAYMTRPVAERWGRPWIERGRMQARFLAPVYEGQELSVRLDGDELEATTEDGLVASGTATLPDNAAPTPLVAGYPTAPVPAERPPAGAGSLGAVEVLGSLEAGFHADRAADYLAEIADDLPLYVDEGIAHPGYLLRDANWSSPPTPDSVRGSTSRARSSTTRPWPTASGCRRRGRVARAVRAQGPRVRRPRSPPGGRRHPPGRVHRSTPRSTGPDRFEDDST